MNGWMLIILLFMGILCVSILSAISSNQKLKLKLEDTFGKVPARQDYSLESIGTYHFYQTTAENHTNWIDATTWDDLDMDKVFRRINACCTSVGEEYLYHLLHTQCFDTASFTKREELIAYLKDNETSRLELQIILSKLGKSDYNGLSTLIRSKKFESLKYPYLYPILGLLPLLAAVLIPFFKAVGIGLLIASFVINIFLYYHAKRKIIVHMLALEYFAGVLWSCNKLCKVKDERLKPFLADLEKNFKVLRSLRSHIPIQSKRSFSELEVLAEYIKILFLSDMRSYNRLMKHIAKHRDCFKALFQNVGELDASISILSFRESLPYYCTPQFHDTNTLDFQGLYHPLLAAAIPNDGIIHRDCIVTGSNASGKSTFIKAIAINGILAQTIYTCTAHSYKARCFLVMTSMAVRDNISEGDSYFITETKSLKRILDHLGALPCLCLIDEILKGTNTIERIAASGAVLEFLHGKNCLCMVASHDIELTELLKNAYDNYHFSEQITEDGIYFDYLLKEGVSQTSNAIKLLHFMGFDAELVENAQQLVEEFHTSHQWKAP